VSICVQALLSLQELPFALVTGAGQPVAGTHAPTVWHWSAPVQVTGVPAQTPAWHLSPLVQALLSLQVVPSALRVGQTPSLGSHVPVLWQASLVQVMAVPAVQTPF
jgi:hypothetical protein